MGLLLTTRTAAEVAPNKPYSEVKYLGGRTRITNPSSLYPISTLFGIFVAEIGAADNRDVINPQDTMTRLLRGNPEILKQFLAGVWHFTNKFMSQAQPGANVIAIHHKLNYADFSVLGSGVLSASADTIARFTSSVPFHPKDDLGQPGSRIFLLEGSRLPLRLHESTSLEQTSSDTFSF